MKTVFSERGLTRRRGSLLHSGNCRKVEENVRVEGRGQEWRVEGAERPGVRQEAQSAVPLFFEGDGEKGGREVPTGIAGAGALKEVLGTSGLSVSDESGVAEARTCALPLCHRTPGRFATQAGAAWREASRSAVKAQSASPLFYEGDGEKGGREVPGGIAGAGALTEVLGTSGLSASDESGAAEARDLRLASLRRTPGRFARLGAAAQGFALLEIVLAIALFSIVAVGMTRALDQIAQTSKQSRQEAQVLRVLESVLAEVAHQPALKETTVNFPKSADGVDARASIVKVKLVTKDKTELASMFKVEAEAWLETGFKRSLKRRMETYVYSPHSP